MQDLRGLRDVPQVGHAEPEALVYLRRAGRSDPFEGGDESVLRRAALDGDHDLADLFTPTRTRALLLAKAYLVLVREQSFERGRDGVVGPVAEAHERIEEESTGLRERGRTYADGRLHLDWPVR